MSIVADTHVLVWHLSADDRMGSRARARLERSLAREELYVSVMSFWEIALLTSHGRLRLEGTATSFRRRVLDMGIRELPVGGEVALQAASLGSVLVDPVDCIVAATALAHGATLVTADRRLLAARVVDVTDARR